MLVHSDTECPPSCAPRTLRGSNAHSGGHPRILGHQQVHSGDIYYNLSSDTRNTRNRMEGTITEQQQQQQLMMKDSADAAQAQVQTWIRAALRETALQAIKKRLNDDDDVVKHNHRQQQNDKIIAPAATTTTMEITETTVTAAIDLCRRVAEKWSEKLQQAGHSVVAAWVQEIVETEAQTLFYDKNSSKKPKAAGFSSHHQAAAAAPSRRNSSTRDKSPSTTSDANDATTTTEATTTATVTWEKLRRLGDHDLLSPSFVETTTTTTTTTNSVDDSYSTCIREAIQTLDEMGQQNDTYWPANQWHVIQQAAKDIPSRLHNNAKKTNIATETIAEAADLLVEDASQDSAETVQQLLNRKRKSSNKKRHYHPPNKRQQATSTTTTTPPVLAAIAEQPRPPSLDEGSMRWSWQQDILADKNWTPQEKQKLNSYLHDNDTSSSLSEKNEPVHSSSLLLGALRDVGRFHHFTQLTLDYDDDETTEMLTDKQRRRRQRAAIQERLGDHDVVRSSKGDTYDAAKQARMSRVIPTIRENSSGGGGQYWFDLDLGHCALEVAETGRDKTLHAFSSLELLLLDEDEDDDDDDAD